MLNKGTAAPDFELQSTPDEKFSLHELKGKNVILAFYPADWSPVCGDQMSLYNETLKIFKKYNAELLGISVDSKWCHAAYSSGTCISPCWQILNPRAPLQNNMARTMKSRVNVREPYLF
jgi:peroxiredoxin